MKRFVPLFLLLTAALFMVIGALRGEPAIVMQKAIRICLECIGLG